MSVVYIVLRWCLIRVGSTPENDYSRAGRSLGYLHPALVLVCGYIGMSLLVPFSLNSLFGPNRLPHEIYYSYRGKEQCTEN